MIASRVAPRSRASKIATTNTLRALPLRMREAVRRSASDSKPLASAASVNSARTCSTLGRDGTSGFGFG